MAIKVTTFVVAMLALVCSVSGDSLESKLTKKMTKRSPQVVLGPTLIDETSSGLVIVPGCRNLPFPYINYCSYKQCWRLPYSYQLVCYNANGLPFSGLSEMNEEEKSTDFELSESSSKVEENHDDERKLTKRSTDEMQDDTHDETQSIVVVPGCRSLPFPYINYCSLRQCWRVPFTYRVICRKAHIVPFSESESSEQTDSAETSGDEK